MDTSVYFLIRARNAFPYFDRCIDSIFSQKNAHYTIIYIDDASNLHTQQKKYVRQKLRDHIVVFNRERKYSVHNAYEAIHKYVPDDGIVISLDGDDWLIGNDVIDEILSVYDKTQCTMTYGNSLYYRPGHAHHGEALTTFHPFANKRYPTAVERNRTYRLTPFRAFHLRTWRAYDFKKLEKSNFLFPDGTWLRFCEDQAIFYALLETPGSSYSVIHTPLSFYNATNEENDERMYLKEKIIDEVAIRKKGNPRKFRVIRDVTKTDHTSTIFVSRDYSNTKKVRNWIDYLKKIILILFKTKNTVSLRNEERALEKILGRLISYQYACCCISTTHIGYSLSYVSLPIILSLKNAIETQVRSLEGYENIMWTLTYTSELDRKTYKLFMKSGIPLSRIIEKGINH